MELVKDALWSILLKVDPYDLKNACVANKQTANICRDPKFKDQYDDIWFGRLKRDYASNPSLGLRRAAQYNYPQLFPYFLNLEGDPLEIYRGLAIGKHYNLLDKIIEKPITPKLKHNPWQISEGVVNTLGETADLKTLKKYIEHIGLVPARSILYSGNDKLLKDIMNSEDQELINYFFNSRAYDFYALLDSYPQFKASEDRFDKIYRNNKNYDTDMNEYMKKLNPLFKSIKNQDLEGIKNYLDNSDIPEEDAEIASYFIPYVTDHPLEIIKTMLPYLNYYMEYLYEVFSKDKDVSDYIKNYAKDNDPVIYNKIMSYFRPKETLYENIIKSVFNL